MLIRLFFVALLLFAWNPLVLLQGPAHAHNDLLMITVATLALVLWRCRLWGSPRCP